MRSKKNSRKINKKRRKRTDTRGKKGSLLVRKEAELCRCHAQPKGGKGAKGNEKIREQERGRVKGKGGPRRKHFNRRQREPFSSS